MQIRGRQKLFYGWWIVAVCLIVLFITLGMGYYSFGVFFNPLIETFGWSRGVVSGAMSVFLLAWGLACPYVGKWTDAYGPLKLIIAGTIGLGVSFCLLGLTGSLWHLYLFYALAGAACATCSEIPTSAAVSNWFIKKRGIAMGMATTGMGFGGLFLAPLTGRAILLWGWRPTYAAMGVLACAAIIPITLLIMKDKPQHIGLLPDGEKNTGWSEDALQARQGVVVTDEKNVMRRKDAPIRLSAILLTGVAFSLFSFGLIGVITHEVPFMIDLGISPTTAASLLGLTAGIGTTGKMGFGYFADKWSPKKVMFICVTLQILGVVILMQSKGLGMIWAFVIIFSFAMGGTNTLRPLVIGEIFGITSFGKTFGMTELMRRLGAASGPFMAGHVFDVFGSYRYAFVTFIAAYLAGMVSLLAIRPGATKQSTV